MPELVARSSDLRAYYPDGTLRVGLLARDQGDGTYRVEWHDPLRSRTAADANAVGEDAARTRMTAIGEFLDGGIATARWYLQALGQVQAGGAVPTPEEKNAALAALVPEQYPNGKIDPKA